jgi:hypothetical protein
MILKLATILALYAMGDTGSACSMVAPQHMLLPQLVATAGLTHALCIHLPTFWARASSTDATNRVLLLEHIVYTYTMHILLVTAIEYSGYVPKDIDLPLLLWTAAVHCQVTGSHHVAKKAMQLRSSTLSPSLLLASIVCGVCGTTWYLLSQSCYPQMKTTEAFAMYQLAGVMAAEASDLLVRTLLALTHGKYTER